ncbi:hypothetical protein QR680_007996 [Steinernema hermaphroditum]|uniref:Uncharacterized protein n=1 Tax=Steinernema hermaphroditum TaxID=289476 RepID=A0AA39IHE2_9BILA|nr:hypothetical protein QR680_007996 [Steinernema hermaphroditum]
MIDCKSLKSLRLFILLLSILSLLGQLGQSVYFIYFLRETERYRQYVLLVFTIVNGIGVVVMVNSFVFISCPAKRFWIVWITLGGSVAAYHCLMLGFDICQVLVMINECYNGCIQSSTWAYVLYIVVSGVRLSLLFISWRLYRMQKKSIT